MGRPYTAELRELDATYDWSVQAPIAELSRSVALCVHRLLVSVGSGGSLTAAHFAGFLHTRFTGQASQTLTPYELVSMPRTLADAAVLICSAGGSNPDVVAAAQLAIKRAPPQLISITMRARSPLRKQFEDAGWPRCHVFSTPTKKDGFLATNSLLATIILLTRAYEAWAGSPTCLPETLDELLHPRMSRETHTEQCREQVARVVERSTLIVLHGTATKPAAMDIESRFTEAALANVQPADFRNFAHGRHHWLARYAASSAVVAFVEDRDEIARRTLALLPPAIPQWRVSVEAGVRGALAAVCQSLLLASTAGEVKGIDPGRPHVAMFGRKLYHLKVTPRLHSRAASAEERMNLAIERKSRIPLTSLAVRGQLDLWLQHYRSFVECLSKARIRAIAVDYDGTLCAPQRRLVGPSDLIADRLNTLLASGITVAVATGRGKSVREALRRQITPARHRARVVVGYHNGAEIGPLTDVDCPPSERPLAPELTLVAQALRESATVRRHATVEAKGQQIALEFLPSGDGCAVLDEAARIVGEQGPCGGLSLVSSSHSVDIIARGVTKSNVVDYLVKRLRLADAGASSILCIGDQGRAPGNDADLLRHPLSLSVDEASDDPSTCWNIARPGLRFDLACLEYLTRLSPTKSGLRFDVKGVRP